MQGVFLSLILIVEHSKKRSKYFLISLVVIVSLNLLNYLVINSSLYVIIPHFAYLGLPLLFLIGPLFLYYVKSILSPQLKLKLTDLLHTVPFILAVVFMLPFFALPSDVKIELLQAQTQPDGQVFDLGTQVFSIAQIIHSFIYVAISLSILYKKPRGNISREFTNKLIWLKRFAVGFSVFWMVDFLALLWYAKEGFIDIRVYYLTMFCCAFAINLLVVLAIRSNKAFREVFLDIIQAKYKSSNLLESELKKHLSDIIAYMEDERPYLHNDLSLPKLSKDLNKPKYLISQVLNVELGKSFYEFLNEYRYNEVKSRLSNPEYHHLTILAIAYDSGFNNKNTFNKVFKKHAGMTPSEYLKMISGKNG
ncbi:helix-turn-helix domain-containing protein [Muricauda sp. JGD-17]|uniref:Helix-turn-helix domain-containing protein n=1 Tax=Flagellimonas ochracea TaxID=2696472 RepID=A0A964TDF4_9FLAO|nr:helix-turn-helix domain-containing protein [Allomuricauda ochracea]NAY92189.1 helix-turn-helix domain-containing protein [Allomuricauda ochracea]